MSAHSTTNTSAVIGAGDDITANTLNATVGTFSTVNAVNAGIPGTATVGTLSGTTATITTLNGTTATIPTYNVDSTYILAKLSVSGSNPTIQFDTLDFCYYDRSTNVYVWMIANAQKLSLTSTTLNMTGDGTFAGTLKASTFQAATAGSAGKIYVDRTSTNGTDQEAHILCRNPANTNQRVMLGLDTTLLRGDLQTMWYGNSYMPTHINAYGGSVGIGCGTTAPGYVLDVNGTFGSSTYRNKDTTDASSISTGSMSTLGGMSAAKSIFVGGSVLSTAANASFGGSGATHFHMEFISTGDVNCYTQATTYVGGFAYGAGAYEWVFTNTIPKNDNLYTLGKSGARWTAVYAVGGVITTSDRRQKKDIFPTALGLDFINKLAPVDYMWKSGPPQQMKKHYHGLISQDVQEALQDNNDGILEMDDQGVQAIGLNYHQLIGPLIKAVQELSAKVVDLQSQIDSLTGSKKKQKTTK